MTQANVDVELIMISAADELRKKVLSYQLTVHGSDGAVHAIPIHKGKILMSRPCPGFVNHVNQTEKCYRRKVLVFCL